MADPTDIDARGDLLYGAALSGMALGATAAGLHHKICHVLGGRFDLVHADAHSVVLPHALAFNAPVLPDEMARLAEALGVPGRRSGGRALGPRRRQQRPDPPGRPRGSDGPLAASARRTAAEQAATEITVNPRPVTARDLLGILERAFDGFASVTISHRGSTR